MFNTRVGATTFPVAKRTIFRGVDMNTTLSSMDSGGDKRLPEASVQSIAQNLTTLQSMQNVQSVVQSNIQSIQSTQTIVGSIGAPASLVAKSMSMDTNTKLPLMKPVVPSGTASTSEPNKITTTVKRDRSVFNAIAICRSWRNKSVVFCSFVP